jgi:Tfp pilus assembly protein PilF
MYRQAIAAGLIDGHNNLGTLLEDLGRTEEAEAQFLSAIDAGDQLALRNYGLFLWDLDRLVEAEQFLERAVQGGNDRAREDLVELKHQRRPGNAVRRRRAIKATKPRRKPRA